MGDGTLGFYQRLTTDLTAPQCQYIFCGLVLAWLSVPHGTAATANFLKTKVYNKSFWHFMPGAILVQVLHASPANVGLVETAQRPNVEQISNVKLVDIAQRPNVECSLHWAASPPLCPPPHCGHHMRSHHCMWVAVLSPSPTGL